MIETSLTLPGRQEAQVDAHEQGDRDGHADREDAPRALAQGVDDDQGEDRDDDDHDSSVAIRAAVPPIDAEFLAGHLAQRAAAAAHGEEQHQVVLDGAGEDDADDDPDGAGQVAHLRGEDRARPAGRRRRWRRSGGRRGRGGPSARSPGRSPCTRPGVARRSSGWVMLLLDDLGVEAVGDQVGADRGEDEPDRVDRLAADDGEHQPGHAAQQRDADPQGDPQRRPPPPLLVEDLRVDGGRRQVRIDRDAARLAAGPVVRGQCHRALRGPGPTLPDAPALLQGP